MARELARLFDQLETEGIAPDALRRLVPDRFAEHWKETLAFLAIVTENWPKLQAEEGCIGTAERRRLLLQARADSWRKNPPTAPVIAAGSTGSIPATADLLAAIAQLPKGMVLLPGLDLESSPAVWDAVAEDPSHPQYGMARLLDRLEISRDEVRPWPAATPSPEAQGRVALVTQALVPAAAGDSWLALRDQYGRQEIADAFAGVTRVDCESAGEEARVAALILREALEQRGQRAALVTPDRRLAQRVAAELKRWNIAIDDSAGQPLASMPVGRLLRLSAQALRDDFAPLSLLALLKHPLVFCGFAPADYRKCLSLLERSCLRGPRPAPGIAGLKLALASAREDRRKPLSSQQQSAVDNLVLRLGAAIEACRSLAENAAVPLSELLDAHLSFCEALVARGGAEALPGAQALWSGEEGEALFFFFSELQESLADMRPLSPKDYPDLLDTLLAGRVLRPRFGLHPRLFIWGPLEARLQSCDVLILSGLNEGTWPDAGDPGPWLSRPMRASLGLPPPERRIGLATHDFSQAVAAPRVYLTRSSKIEGAPSVPSRWLLRLEALLKGLGLADHLAQGAAPWLAWARSLDRPEEVRPLEAPAPRPPLAARPRRLPVTAIETWRRDPYSLYARYILGLRALDPVDADPAAAERGILIHAILEEFVRRHPKGLPPKAFEELLEIGRQSFRHLRANPGLYGFWWQRFTRVATWFLEQEERRRGGARRIMAEVAGEITFEAPAGPFTLTATADRIELLGASGLAIIDYKTGGTPTSKDIASGFAPQLPLEAAIAQAGGFEGVPADSVTELAFWRLQGGTPAGEAKPVKQNPGSLAQEAIAGLRQLVEAFDNPETPYLATPWPHKAARFNDYGHLARLLEWGVGEEGEG
jgi:ATP-dependent helicase/nuclease subunit B